MVIGVYFLFYSIFQCDWVILEFALLILERIHDSAKPLVMQDLIRAGSLDRITHLSVICGTEIPQTGIKFVAVEVLIRR